MSESERAILDLLTRISKQLEQIAPDEAGREEAPWTNPLEFAPPTPMREWS